MAASDIPVRSNGGTVVAAWWNAIRTFLIELEGKVNAFLGAGASSTEATFAIADNTTGASITGLVASPLYRVTRVRYWVKRIATATVIESGELVILYDGATFQIGRAWRIGDAGITFDITPSGGSAGQVLYTTDDMAGSYDTVNSLIGYTRTTQGTI